jgi:hypothetical protein
VSSFVGAAGAAACASAGSAVVMLTMAHAAIVAATPDILRMHVFMGFIPATSPVRGLSVDE